VDSQKIKDKIIKYMAQISKKTRGLFKPVFNSKREIYTSQRSIPNARLTQANVQFQMRGLFKPAFNSKCEAQSKSVFNLKREAQSKTAFNSKSKAQSKSAFNSKSKAQSKSAFNSNARLNLSPHLQYNPGFLSPRFSLNMKLGHVVFL